MSEIRIATRRSDLATAQARWVGQQLVRAHHGLAFRLVEVTTTGDRDQVSPVASLTEVGAFVRAVQEAVLDGDADVAVHSCKDLPVTGPPGLRTFYPVREMAWDVLCGSTLEAIPAGGRVGTGSPRRRSQLLALRPDLVVDEIRGNVDTRLGKVASGEFDAVVLAEAGLRRLGLDGAIGERFPLEAMVPAPAQGALAVETRRGGMAPELVSAVDDQECRQAVTAERSVLEETGAGCRAALGVFAQVDPDGSMALTGFVEDHQGARRASVTGAGSTVAVERLIRGLGL